jgi:hypothetical protein
MDKCVQMIEWTIHDLLNVFDTSVNDDMGNSVSLTFSMIDNTSSDFMVLSHKLIRESLI